jgi:nicotinamide riboside kinase
MNTPRHPIFVFYGHDGAGKTTLIERMQRIYGGKRIHLGYRWKSEMFRYHLAAIRRAVRFASTEAPVYLDRGWLCENVYADEYRGGSQWPHMGRMLDRVLLAYGALNVVCSLDPTTAGSNHLVNTADRHELFADGMDRVASRYLKLLAGRNDLLPRTSYPDDLGTHIFDRRHDWIRHNWKAEPVDEYCRYLMTKWIGNESLAGGYLPSREHRNIVGNTAKYGKYMICGDRTKTDEYRRGWPFIEYQHSSLYLAQALHRINLPEHLTAYTNVDCIERWYDHPRFKDRRYLALGRNASDVLTEAGIEHGMVPHPSYHKRFCHDNEAYAKLIEENLYEK